MGSNPLMQLSKKKEIYDPLRKVVLENQYYFVKIIGIMQRKRKIKKKKKKKNAIKKCA